MADLQSPFENPAMSAPSGAGDGIDVSGGYDLADGKKESANLSALPPLPTTYDVQGGGPGTFGQVDMPPVASPGTFKAEGV